MKRILLLVSGIILAGSVFAQPNIEIIRVGGITPINDSVIIVNGTVSQPLLTIPFYVINNNGVKSNIKVKRIDSVVVPHTSNYLCWGLCYGANPATVWQCPATEAIPAGGTDSTFTSDYSDSAQPGTEIIRYIFFNAGNPNDSSWVIVKFNVTPAGVAQINSNALHVSAPYPNPANTNVSFNYNMKGAQNATLEIYNSIGRCVQTLPVSSANGKLSLSVSDLPAGVYICKLGAAGYNPVYQRLIVAH